MGARTGAGVGTLRIRRGDLNPPRRTGGREKRPPSVAGSGRPGREKAPRGSRSGGRAGLRPAWGRAQSPGVRRAPPGEALWKGSALRFRSAAGPARHRLRGGGLGSRAPWPCDPRCREIGVVINEVPEPSGRLPLRPDDRRASPGEAVGRGRPSASGLARGWPRPLRTPCGGRRGPPGRHQEGGRAAHVSRDGARAVRLGLGAGRPGQASDLPARRPIALTGGRKLNASAC
jgi:hypothetical protein